MSKMMPLDTSDAIGVRAEKCDSRSLLLDRFVDPAAKKEERKNVFLRAIRKPAIRAKADAWPFFIKDQLGLKFSDCIFAELKSRLMINMAGGVMENAGLCLDRFGVPYIPGSAVKGCARRAAVAALREWCAADRRPAGDHPLSPCCENMGTPAQMLGKIALVFGWTEQEWDPKKKDGRFNSDFFWATASESDPTYRVVTSAISALLRRHGICEEDADLNRARRKLPNFRGAVSFLPAYPVITPPTDLELDVVTCHHPDYYGGKDEYKNAPDNEEPNPVVFPAVAPSHVFIFGVVPINRIEDDLLTSARKWLKVGLEALGIGAKTNAGYGWFECSENTKINVIERLRADDQRRREEEERRREESRRTAEEEEKRRKREEYKQRTSNMSPEEKADYDLAQLNEAQFDGRLNDFMKRDPAEKRAIVRALRMPANQPGSRREFWEKLKIKAEKGGKPRQIEQEIRRLSKEMFPGKEGKMP